LLSPAVAQRAAHSFRFLAPPGMPKSMHTRWFLFALVLANTGATADGRVQVVVNETETEVTAEVALDDVNTFDENAFSKEVANPLNLTSGKTFWIEEKNNYILELTYGLTGDNLTMAQMKTSLANKVVQRDEAKVELTNVSSGIRAAIKAQSPHEVGQVKGKVADVAGLHSMVMNDFDKQVQFNIIVQPVAKFRVVMKMKTDSGLTKEDIQTALTTAAQKIGGNATLTGDIKEEVTSKKVWVTTTSAPSSNTAVTTTSAPSSNTAASSSGGQAEVVTEVKAEVAFDDLSTFDKKVFQAQVAQANGLDASKVLIDKVEYKVGVTYEFNAAVTEAEAKASIANAMGVVQDQVAVTIRSARRLFGDPFVPRRRLAGSRVDAVIKAETLAAAKTIKSDAQDVDKVNQELTKAGKKTQATIVVQPVAKIEVMIKMKTAQDAPKFTKEATETFMTKVAQAIGGNVTVVDVMTATPSTTANAPEHVQPAVCAALLMFAMGTTMQVV